MSEAQGDIVRMEPQLAGPADAGLRSHAETVTDSGEVTCSSPLAGVYAALADHQIAESWDYQDVAKELRRWSEIFLFEFKLEVPRLSLCLERLSCRRYGHFRPGHNAFGLRGEIALNSRYLRMRPFFDVLGTLLHELLHAWQELHGRPGAGNYHNKELQRKAEGLGLIIDSRGYTEYAPKSAFRDLLDRYGVKVPELPNPVPHKPLASTSKLKKWSCGCTNIRVAVPIFRARCLRCGEEFAQSSPLLNTVPTFEAPVDVQE